MPEESERFKDMISRYPPFLRRDPDLRSINLVSANELDWVEERINELMENTTPTQPALTDYEGLFLQFWESLFQLPVDPPERTMEQRRTTVISYLRRLSQGAAGTNWIARVIDQIGADWIYVVNTPDGLRGLLWDRFFEIDEDWTWMEGDPNDLVVADPSGIVPNLQDRFAAWQSSIDKLPDQEVCVQFGHGNKVNGATVAAILKRIDDENYLHVGFTRSEGSGTLYIEKVDGGTPESLATVAVEVKEETRYWIAARIEGDKVTVELWESDPTKNDSREPIKTLEETLEGEDAEQYGDEVYGYTGMLFDGLTQSWLVRQIRINQIGYKVPENTLRVTIPYDAESFKAFEIEKLLRAITPANTELQIFNDVGFILDFSQLDAQSL